MMYENNYDPYVYPGTNVLINRFDIKDSDLLLMKEVFFSRLRYEQEMPEGNFDYSHYKAIHHHLFQDIYEWAGSSRIINISKGSSLFASCEYVDQAMNTILNRFSQCSEDISSPPSFSQRIAYYFSEINAIHPFREGNGRTLRAFLDCYCKRKELKINWTSISRDRYIQAVIAGFNGDNIPLERLFLTSIEKPSIHKKPRSTL